MRAQKHTSIAGSGGGADLLAQGRLPSQQRSLADWLRRAFTITHHDGLLTMTPDGKLVRVTRIKG